MRITLFLSTLLFAATATAAEPAPTIQTLLASHAKAIGPIDKVQSRRLRMRVIGVAPFDLPVVTEAVRPNLLRKEVSIQGSTQITAFDGKAAWKIDPFVPGGDKPAALPALEAKALMEEAQFDGVLPNAAALGIKLSYAGPAQVNGKPAHAIKGVLADGGSITIWLDAASYLEVKRTHPGLVMGKMQPLDTYMSDYRDVAGLKIPHRIESGLSGAKEKMSIVMDAVELNAPIERTRFAQPAPK